MSLVTRTVVVVLLTLFCRLFSSILTQLVFGVGFHVVCISSLENRVPPISFVGLIAAKRLGKCFFRSSNSFTLNHPSIVDDSVDFRKVDRGAFHKGTCLRGVVGGIIRRCFFLEVPAPVSRKADVSLGIGHSV